MEDVLIGRAVELIGDAVVDMGAGFDGCCCSSVVVVLDVVEEEVSVGDDVDDWFEGDSSAGFGDEGDFGLGDEDEGGFA